MSTVGDRFPERARREYVERHLNPGEVLYLFCPFTTPPKNKYLVLACATPRPLLFMINTSIHRFIASRPALRRCQVALSATEYGFMEHDSFIDCAEVIDYFDRAAITGQILAHVARLRGELAPSTKGRIIQAVRDARTISARHKKLITGALKGRRGTPQR